MMVYFWFDLSTSGNVVIIIGQPVHMKCLVVVYVVSNTITPDASDD